MIQEYNYWGFESALTPRTCDDIVAYGKHHQLQSGTIGGLEEPHKLNNKQYKDLRNKRKSEVVWMDDWWIYKEIYPYVKAANKNAKWNFDWDTSESCQFTKYGINQHYGWHCDSWPKPYNRPNNLKEHGKIRKLSVTCQLTDHSEYEGGDLEFKILQDSTGKAVTVKLDRFKSRGSIIVFPSYVTHRVKPVISGTRYSLVIWNLGLPFK
jgi:PKHD-type hydroxylase|tara:strand:+ start:565 stop:1191 length:627 start_codon:yes stop_codon:yes gene_type:complete